MDGQIANAFAQQIVQHPAARPFFQRAVQIGFSDDTKTVVVMIFSPDGGLSLEQRWADDPSVKTLSCQIAFTPRALAAVSAGGACPDPPEVSGQDADVARDLLSLLGIRDAAAPASVGDPAEAVARGRSRVFDAQLGSDRATYSPFTANEPGPYDCRHWQIEAGVTPAGVHFAVSAGLTDPETTLRPARPDARPISGLGYELVLLTDAAGAVGAWHVGMVGAALRELANTERPFGNPDWIDWNQPLCRGGSCEGFLITESRRLESPYALSGTAWGRFLTLIALTRPELDVLNTQKEPTRVLRLLVAGLGDPELSDPFRAPVSLW